MKFTPEVQAALQTLKDNAENDFERHRIAVLEKDLTAPPVVEQIDENHQKFNGITYYKNKSRGRYLSNAVGIHRVIWIYYHGDIPTDNSYEVHHINGDKTDNNISNLQLLTKSEHQNIHSLQKAKSPLDIVCPICEKIFHRKSATSKYCSVDCANKAKFKYSINAHHKTCPTCGKIFFTTRIHQIYCSVACSKQKPPVEKTCPICEEKFVTNMSSKRIFCSRECYLKFINTTNIEKTCPVCGKSFSCQTSKEKENQIYCSISCANKMRWQISTSPDATTSPLNHSAD